VEILEADNLEHWLQKGSQGYSGRAHERGVLSRCGMDPEGGIGSHRKEIAIVLLAAVTVSFAICILRNFSPAWGSIESIDFTVYWSALTLFFSPDNPYNPQAALQEQQKISTNPSGEMAWSPPILFLMLAPLLSLPFYVAKLAWTFMTTLFSVLSAYLSARFFSSRPLSFPIWILYSVLFLPFLYEITIGQIASYLNFIFLASLVLFRNGRYASAGAIAAALLVKPHMFYLMLLWFFLVSIVDKRWSFILGFGLSVLGGSVLAEMLHPGINSQWLMRESWPTQNVGSTLPLLVRVALLSCCNINSYIPQLVIPTITSVGFVLALLRSKGSAGRTRGLLLAIMLCPLTAPYGHVFDQVVLLTPIVGILRCVHEGDVAERLRMTILASPVLLQAGVLALSNVRLFGMDLSWYPMPLIVLALWLFMERCVRTSMSTVAQ
jgi:hypothetical protein